LKSSFLMLSIVFVLLSCRKQETGYPLELNLMGPYEIAEYIILRDSLWIKRPIELDGWGDYFYIAEISNLSNDTTYISISEYAGIIRFSELCLKGLKDDYLAPHSIGPIIEDFMEWDMLLPNTSKRYLHQPLFDYGDCDYIQFLLDVRSTFFDSLNIEAPISYRVGKAALRRNHPVFLFKIDEGRFIPEKSMDIQKELDRTMREMEKMYKKRKAE
jgi:hypothetical protein